MPTSPEPPSDQRVAHAASAIAPIASAIEGIQVAMLTTVGEDGELHSRPMQVTRAGFDDYLWFFTAAGSGKAEELAGDPHVNVCFVDPVRQRFVSITGHAHVEQDVGRAAALWSVDFRAWFPEGLDDPQLALIKVTPLSAQYWDGGRTRFVRLLERLHLRSAEDAQRRIDHRRVNLRQPRAS
jgi:general stress protein 26